jgi:peroxiredoxin Q/BCP
MNLHECLWIPKQETGEGAMKTGLILIFALSFIFSLMAREEKTMTLKVGDKAPEFQLKDQNENVRTLSEFHGKKVVLYFYPKDDTPGCTKEACSFRDGYKDLQDAGIVILGVSFDSPESHRKFIEKYDLPFDLLSDADKQVAKVYGAAGGLLGWAVANRMTYLIDENGKIVHIFEKVNVKEHADEVLQAFSETENQQE